MDHKKTYIYIYSRVSLGGIGYLLDSYLHLKIKLKKKTKQTLSAGFAVFLILPSFVI